MTRPLSSLLALLLTLGCLSVHAQVYTTDPLMKARTMYDGDVPIVQSRGLSLHNPLGDEDAITPTISTERHDALSYDITYTFTNSSGTSRPLGRICVGTLALGEDITIYDHDQVSEFKDLNYDRFAGTGWRYPGIAYSPAMVMMNDTHVVGVSLLYPVMEYQHDVLVRLSKLGGVFKGPPEGRGWMVAFDLNDTPGVQPFAKLPHVAMLAPGATQSYTVCVRAMRRPDPFPSKYTEQDWLRVLEPYRDYFQSQNDPVSYERRTKPVYGVALAHEITTNAQNPRGWTVEAMRPDRLGFAPLVNHHIQRDWGYDNVMIWAPSGLFREHPEYNYPSRFTAGWLDSDRLRTALDDVGFAAIPRSGKELGLWWGRAAQHMDRWDDADPEPLDPDNSEHMDTVYLQLDLAQQVGATTIGLDAFVHKYMPVWKQKPYLADLRSRYPGVSFVTEQMSSDLIHAVAPTVNRGYLANGTPRLEPDYHRLKHPHYLADYLNPGHEIWAVWRYGEILRSDPSQVIDHARLQRDVERLARNGYVAALPGIRLRLEYPERANADETWQTTLPSDEDEQDSETPPGDDEGEGRSGSDDDSPGGDGGTDKDLDPSRRPTRVYHIMLPNGKRLRIESR